MDYWVDLDEFDMAKIEKFARSIEKDCQEGVRWERRKLECLRPKRTGWPEERRRSSQPSRPSSRGRMDRADDVRNLFQAEILDQQFLPASKLLKPAAERRTHRDKKEISPAESPVGVLQPVNCLTVVARNRSERAPFVEREIGIARRILRAGETGQQDNANSHLPVYENAKKSLRRDVARPPKFVARQLPGLHI